MEKDKLREVARSDFKPSNQVCYLYTDWGVYLSLCWLYIRMIHVIIYLDFSTPVGYSQMSCSHVGNF